MSRELVERAMRGDRDAFGILASRSLARLTGAAALILRDGDAADDAVQETLVRAWRDLPALRDPDRFDAWVHRVLVHACGDELRRAQRERRRQVAVQAQPLAAANGSRLAERDELERALARLNPDQRTVVVLHYYLGLTHPEVAEAIGQPVGTVKSRLSRSLDVLQSALAADRRLEAPKEGSA